jgi:hypothetical protein
LKIGLFKIGQIQIRRIQAGGFKQVQGTARLLGTLAHPYFGG